MGKGSTKQRMQLIAILLVSILIILIVENKSSWVRNTQDIGVIQEPNMELIDINKGDNDIHKISRDIENILKGNEPTEVYTNTDLRAAIVNYYQRIQERETVLVDIDALIISYTEDTTGTGDSYVYEFEETDAVDTEAIHYTNGTAYIRAIDLEYDKEDNAKVIYGGKIVYIHKSMVGETYTGIQEKARNIKVHQGEDIIKLTNEEGTLSVEVHLRKNAQGVESIEIDTEV